MKGLIFKWWWVTWSADIEHTSYVRMYVHTATVWRRGGDVGVAYVLCVPQYLYLIWVGSLTDLSLYVYHCLLCAPRSKGTWDKLLTEFYVCASWVTSLFDEQVEHTHSITVTAIVMAALTQWLIHTLSDFIHFRLQNCIYICKYIRIWAISMIWKHLHQENLLFLTHQTVKINSVGGGQLALICIASFPKFCKLS